MSGGGLERKLAVGEHEFMETKVKTKGKRDLWLRRSTTKLLGMTSAMDELQNGQIEGGNVRACKR